MEEHFVGGNRVLLLRDGVQAFPAMLDAIRGAERQVLLEMYWLDSDRTGRRFATALADAAGRGVEVALLYDSLGSWEAESSMFAELEQAGVAVIEFNPLAPWKKRFRLGRMTRRNHRKVLVVDSSVGFTGGANLADPWLPLDEGGQGWRDDVIRVEGPCVTGLIDSFLHGWRREGGRRLTRVKDVRCLDGGSHNVRVLGENYSRHRREIMQAYLYNIYRAKKRVWITNSYFLPDHTVVRALRRAARRGVDVRVLLPGVSDVEIVRHATRAMWGWLMRAGVRLYEWMPSILHSKSAVIDGRWSTTGTFNLDYRSIRANLEVNVAVLDEGFAQVMEASFLQDLEQSREVDIRAYAFRSLGDRLLEVIFYGLRRFL